MTKFLLSCLIVVVAVSASAQIKKNSVLLGGQINFNGSKDKDKNDNKNQSIQSNLLLSIGTAVRENAVVGLILGYSPQANKYFRVHPDTSWTVKSEGYSFGAFYRKYKKIGKDLYLFGEVKAAYYYNGPSKPNNGYQRTVNGGYANFVPGITYRIYKKLYVEGIVNDVVYLQYTQTKTDYTNQTSKNSEFNLGTSITSYPLNGSRISLGFKFII